MPMSRRCTGTSVMSLPPTWTRPQSGSSKPAIMRSVVVLPQPDGPSSEKNSPAAMSSVDPVDGDDAAVEDLGDPPADLRSHALMRGRSSVTRASMSSLRALYHFQSGWISVATFSGVVSSFASYLASSFTFLLAGEYHTASARSFCTSGRSM